MESVHRMLVITTGGTIDAQYDPEEATPYHVPVPPSASDTAVPAAMRQMGIDGNCDFLRFSMKDSKDVSEADLDRIAHYARAGGYERLLLVTGTDRMAEIGQNLEKRLGAQVSILLTGAMGPLRDKHGAWRPEESVTLKNDGWKNLRRACHDLQRGMPGGAYIRMGDECWPASRVTKDVTLDGAGPTARVTDSGFRALVHPQSRGPKISH